MTNELNTRCLFRYDDGNFCKRWAQRGSRFCYNHQPQGEAGLTAATLGAGHSAGDWPQLHPHARLSTPSDLFDLVRETLNAVRMGTLPRGHAADVTSLSLLWLKIHGMMKSEERLYALSSQIIPTLVDAESAAHAERVQRQTAEHGHARELEAQLDKIVRFGPPEEEPAPAHAENPPPVLAQTPANGDRREEAGQTGGSTRD